MIASTSQYLSPTAAGVKRAAELLVQGKLVAFPTETVYGLGANAFNVSAVKEIFVAKGRPLTDPLIVHVSNKEAALQLLQLNDDEEGSEMKTVFHKLCDSFWPGPLTIITLANSSIPMEVTAQTGYVGVRVPAHPLAQRLLRECAVPVAAPSANRFGHVSPTRAAHVMDDLGSKGVYILDGEAGGDYCDNGDSVDDKDTNTSDAVDDRGSHHTTCQHGIESTVVKLNKELRQVNIYRQGAVSQRQLEAALAACVQLRRWVVTVSVRVVDMHAAPSSSSSAIAAAPQEGQEAPGQAVTHYSPDVPCLIATSVAAGSSNDSSSSSVSSDVLYLRSAALHSEVVLIDFGGQFSAYSTRALAYRELSASGSVAEAARVLFSSLRWSEGVEGAKLVLLPSIADNGDCNDISLGLADRLFRAASGRARSLVIEEE